MQRHLSAYRLLSLVFTALAGSVTVALPVLAAGTDIAARACSEDDISAAVDSLASRLKQVRSGANAGVPEKLARLADKKGLHGEDAEGRALELVEDATTRALDDKAAVLLARLNQLSDAGDGKSAQCERLDEVKVTIDEIVDITGSKTTHISGKLDVALGQEGDKQTSASPKIINPEAPAAQPNKAETKASELPKADPAKKELTNKELASKGRGPAEQTPSSSPAPPGSAWKTQTEKAPSRPDPGPPKNDAYMPPPVGDLPDIEPRVLAVMPPRAERAAEAEFTEAEVWEASHGFFGALSGGLASVIQYAFKSYGRPNGYILGTEGGGAFLAGLRYGKGEYATKISGSSKIFWQGPSIGYDFGAAGSRVMILVYNLDAVEDIYSRFGGIDGSAYVIGGAGITFMKRGNILLAPIRTGLGLRVGANVGYLKFTPEASINPF